MRDPDLDDPGLEGPGPTDAQLARITAQVAAGMGVSPWGRASRVARLRAAVILVVLACAAGGFAAVVNGRHDGLHGRRLVAASEGTPGLDDLADAARARREPALGSAGHEVAHVVLSYRLDNDDPHRWTTETWARADGTGRRTTTPTAGTGSHEPTTQVFDAAGTLPEPGLTNERMARFEGRPAALLSEILRVLLGDADHDRAGDVSVAIAELLSWPGTPPALRGELYDVLALAGFRPTSADATTVELEGPGADDDRYTITIDRATVRPVEFRNRPGAGDRSVGDMTTTVDLATTEPEPG